MVSSNAVQKSWSNNFSMDLCLSVSSMVLLRVLPLEGNLTFMVVMVFAMSRTS
ncbi:MAG: hypothetical protein LBU89_10535 [Fibromonadaceae bacterium]|nr:hypothetical protein [Fibromonadaceae bacterium]